MINDNKSEIETWLFKKLFEHWYSTLFISLSEFYVILSILFQHMDCRASYHDIIQGDPNYRVQHRHRRCHCCHHHWFILHLLVLVILYYDTAPSWLGWGRLISVSYIYIYIRRLVLVMIRRPKFNFRCSGLLQIPAHRPQSTAGWWQEDHAATKTCLDITTDRQLPDGYSTRDTSQTGSFTNGKFQDGELTLFPGLTNLLYK